MQEACLYIYSLQQFWSLWHGIKPTVVTESDASRHVIGVILMLYLINACERVLRNVNVLPIPTAYSYLKFYIWFRACFEKSMRFSVSFISYNCLFVIQLPTCWSRNGVESDEPMLVILKVNHREPCFINKPYFKIHTLQFQVNMHYYSLLGLFESNQNWLSLYRR
jgi:hypothetical protein